MRDGRDGSSEMVEMGGRDGGQVFIFDIPHLFVFYSVNVKIQDLTTFLCSCPSVLCPVNKPFLNKSVPFFSPQNPQKINVRTTKIKTIINIIAGYIIELFLCSP